MENGLKSYIQKLPAGTQYIVLQALQMVPDDIKKELDSTMNVVSGLVQHNPMAAADLVEILKRQAGPAFAPLSRIAVVGPVNAGKSTLFNAVLEGIGFKAEVSPIPGETKVSQEGCAGPFSLIDTPGLDNAVQEGVQERDTAMYQAKNADFLLIIFDASRGITTSDAAMFQDLLNLNKPYLIVLNKIDLIKQANREAVINQAALSLNQAAASMPQYKNCINPVTADCIHTISAEKKDGISELLLKLSACEPRLLEVLGKTAAPLRKKFSWQAIRRAAISATAISLVPLPIVSFIPLAAIQSALVITLARIHNIKITPLIAKELIASLGVGLLARNAFSELSKLAGPAGWAVSASIAAAGTVIIGYSAMMWFDIGIKPSSEAIKSLMKMLSEFFVNSFKKFKNKTNKQEVENAAEQAMDELAGSLDKEYENTKTRLLSQKDLQNLTIKN